MMPESAHIRDLLAEADRRYQQRYEAQKEALDAAFKAQETAMQTALLAQKEAVNTAMLAAEKAVTKAEVATEKRFDSVNEFRGAYQDVIASQMPRSEAEQRLHALGARLDELKDVASNGTGRAAGINQGWLYLLGALTALASVVSIFLALTG